MGARATGAGGREGAIGTDADEDDEAAGVSVGAVVVAVAAVGVVAVVAGADVATGFLGFVVMTTKKSLGFIPQAAMVSSSFKTFPEWMSFWLAADSSDLACSYVVVIVRNGEENKQTNKQTTPIS